MAMRCPRCGANRAMLIREDDETRCVSCGFAEYRESEQTRRERAVLVDAWRREDGRSESERLAAYNRLAEKERGYRAASRARNRAKLAAQLAMAMGG